MIGKVPFILFSLWPMLSLCQPSITRTESQLLFRNSPSIKLIRYTVKNTMDDTIYVWLQKKDTSSHGENSFIRYFFSRDTAFPLSMLCFDGSVFFEDSFVPVIGSNFIKRLNPDDSFNIYSLNCDVGSSVIHYEQLKNVKKIVPPKRLDEFSFILDYIVIDTIAF